MARKNNSKYNDMTLFYSYIKTHITTNIFLNSLKK